MPRNVCSAILAVMALLIMFDTSPAKESAYQPNWDSLAAHDEAPDWFADAKLGIYFHWGIYSVPAFATEWYPHRMHFAGNKIRKHHEATYGPLTEFGYHDFVPMFKAEHFDPADWAELFQQAGARFAGPVAQHHDGFAMWASTVNKWNVKDRGPQRDITGELAQELRKRDMKLITTFHHARNLQRYANDPVGREKSQDSHFPYRPGLATASTDPELAQLYGNIPADEFHEYWLNQLKEVIDQYSPEIVWFDSWLDRIPEAYRQEFSAYYFNEAKQKNQEVVIAYKQQDLPTSVGVLDIEQGGKTDVSEDVWLTDITLSHRSWCFIDGQTYKDVNLLVRNMIDVWSKNGIVLLNISPRADGTIPQQQRDVLQQLGEWLGEYGEAVYGTRPFDIYGTGTAQIKKGHFGGQAATIQYSADDVRFTVSKNDKTMYLFFLGKPQAGEQVTIQQLGTNHHPPHGPIKRITLLSTEADAEWDLSADKLTLTIPDAPLNEIANVFRLDLE
ncbi:MAG: alpha-L-fucosidase [Bythopirellula sp.]